MKRLIVKILLLIIRFCLRLFEKLTGLTISAVGYSNHKNWLEIEVWQKDYSFEWEEYKDCNYKIQLTEGIRITYWDIEEDFNTMKGVNYNE